MKIVYKESHRSIEEFAPTDLPDFTILTGLNGSGKTQFLQAIKIDKIQVDHFSNNEIEYFNYHNFKLSGLNKVEFNEIERRTHNAWAELQSKHPSVGKSWIEILHDLYQELFIRNKNGKASDILKKELSENLSIWEAFPRHKEFSESLQYGIPSYVNRVELTIFQNGKFSRFTDYANIVTAIKKLSRLDRLITESDFKQAFVPLYRERQHLSTSLSILFTQYRVNQFRWIHDQWEKGDLNASISTLRNQYEARFKKPWILINEFLERIHEYTDFGMFKFRFTTPESDVLSLDSWQRYSFTPRLINQFDDEEIKIEDLSSGEQVLLALAISIYASRNENSLPKLLLLDEIDASLHPSMTKALLSVVQDVFLKRGTKVILATHSPSTVALAPEGSVFVIHRDNRPGKIAPMENQEALEFLTEGYITLEKGLAIFNEITAHDLCIITEGSNIHYIQKALAIYEQEGVEIVKGMESVTGKNQLSTLFQLLSNSPMTKPVLFILDCDVKTPFIESDNCFTLILPKNAENTLTPRGIENMFPNHLFDGFISEAKDSRGTVTQQFDPRRKKDFLNHILANAQYSDFKNFKVISDKLDHIRAKN